MYSMREIKRIRKFLLSSENCEIEGIKSLDNLLCVVEDNYLTNIKTNAQKKYRNKLRRLGELERYIDEEVKNNHVYLQGRF